MVPLLLQRRSASRRQAAAAAAAAAAATEAARAMAAAAAAAGMLCAACFVALDAWLQVCCPHLTLHMAIHGRWRAVLAVADILCMFDAWLVIPAS